MRGIVRFFIPLLLLLFLKCSLDIAGGGSEGEAITITVYGTVVLEPGGQPAPNTEVHLVPHNHNPVTDTLSNSLIDTTDYLGGYYFNINISDTGAYNLEAMHIINGKRLLRSGIYVAGDTVIVPQTILRDPGYIKLFLPDTIDTINGYVFIEGTTIYGYLTETVSDSSGLSVLIDSVPAASIPYLYYDRLNNPSAPTIISGPIEVIPNDTTVLDPYVNWVQYTTTNSDLPGNEVVDVYICNSSFPWMHDSLSIWFSCYTYGIGVFNKSTWEIYDFTTSAIPTENVLQVLRFDNSNNVWVASLRGLLQFNGSLWRVFDTLTGIPTNLMSRIALDSDGDIWAGMHYGIGFFDAGLEQWTIYDTVATGLDRHFVEGVAVDKNDNPWFATSTGVGYYNGSSWQVYTTSSGLLADNTKCVAVDSMNILWFGHWNGLSRYDGSTWSTFTTADSKILTGFTQTIVADKDNNIWVGTQTGLTRYDGTTWKDYDGERYTFLENKSIRSIDIDDEGTVWMGTDSSGVIGFGPGIK